MQLRPPPTKHWCVLQLPQQLLAQQQARECGFLVQPTLNMQQVLNMLLLLLLRAQGLLAAPVCLEQQSCTSAVQRAAMGKSNSTNQLLTCG
jgi:hypothetical protein